MSMLSYTYVVGAVGELLPATVQAFVTSRSPNDVFDGFNGPSQVGAPLTSLTGGMTANVLASSRFFAALPYFSPPPSHAGAGALPAWGTGANVSAFDDSAPLNSVPNESPTTKTSRALVMLEAFTKLKPGRQLMLLLQTKPAPAAGPPSSAHSKPLAVSDAHPANRHSGRN